MPIVTELNVEAPREETLPSEGRFPCDLPPQITNQAALDGVRWPWRQVAFVVSFEESFEHDGVLLASRLTKTESSTLGFQPSRTASDHPC